ncbi:MAG: hypothetical protein D3924_16190 [Candidatus Electrothrix sp. AR4]|nr:hypothetical protein [Candidatus Electrothrix sp. AR4]
MSSVKKELLFWCITSFVTGASVCLAGLPEPEQCTTCHGVDVIYKEWAGSVHAERGVKCFSCHISGKKQEETGLLDSGEKEGFHILGYFNGVGFTRVERDEVCVRCHETAHNAASRRPKCVKCHMPNDGLTTYRVHNYDPDSENPDLNTDLKDPQSIRKYVTRPHRVHEWNIPSERSRPYRTLHTWGTASE